MSGFWRIASGVAISAATVVGAPSAPATTVTPAVCPLAADPQGDTTVLAGETDPDGVGAPGGSLDLTSVNLRLSRGRLVVSLGVASLSTLGTDAPDGATYVLAVRLNGHPATAVLKTGWLYGGPATGATASLPGASAALDVDQQRVSQATVYIDRTRNRLVASLPLGNVGRRLRLSAGTPVVVDPDVLTPHLPSLSGAGQVIAMVQRDFGYAESKQLTEFANSPADLVYVGSKSSYRLGNTC
jgi:hypothetical protein